jgi:hypothetical protein
MNVINFKLYVNISGESWLEAHTMCINFSESSAIRPTHRARVCSIGVSKVIRTAFSIVWRLGITIVFLFTLQVELAHQMLFDLCRGETEEP